MVEISVTVKSNIMLKSRGIIHPIENMPREYFDVRLDDQLTPSQKLEKEKINFWAKEIRYEKFIISDDLCFKNCINCGQFPNNCIRLQNIKKLKKAK